MPDRNRSFKEIDGEVVETAVREDDGFRLADEAPNRANPIARANQGAGRAVDGGGREGAGTRVPGRVAAPTEARAMHAGLALDAETALAVGQATAALALEMGDVQDVIDDAEALRLAHRRADAPIPLAGPPQAYLPTPDRANLPALLDRPVYQVDTVRAGVPAPIEPRWSQIYDCHGFYQQTIRVMGRALFGSFPCFRRQEQECVARGDDPLGAVHLVANLQGAGPNTTAEVDQVARWIKANGVAVDATSMTFAGLPGYEPRVVVCCDADTTYLLVIDRREWGAPVDGEYVYSWQGGLAFYAGHGDRLADLRDVRIQPVLPPRGRNALPPAGRVAPGRGVRPAQQALPAAQPRAPVVPLDKARDKRKIAALPLQHEATLSSTFTQGLSARGFKRTGTADGPAFVKEEDGRRLLVLGEPGKPLAASASFRLRVSDVGDADFREETVASLDDFDAALAPSAPSP